MFWIMAGAVLLAAGALILRALLSAPSDADGAVQSGLAVYRAQLAEVDRDLTRATISPTDADALRLEIKRRILEADRAGQGRSDAPAQQTRPAALGLPLALTAAILAASIFLYYQLGAPGYPDVPHQDRVARAEAIKAARPTQSEAEAEAAKTRPAPPPPPADFAKLMDELRAAIEVRPDDVTGLRLLATNERRIGNLQAAARAGEKLIATLGDQATAEDHVMLADILISAAGGMVTAQAEAEIAATLKADPTNGTARFYAGLLEAQIGRPDRAFPIWRELRADSPPEAPWVAYIDSQMELLAAAAGVDYAPVTKGPGAADMEAASAMSEAERAEMINGMVEGLEGRLFAEGGSGAEWAQLLTALGVLGDSDRARAAWAKAQSALKDQPDALAEARAAAQAAGVAE
ncbi:MAG TPA: c-type cytochrome biogenesis protein CcmI [Paracoccaceae bacterium]|nr:c-type cytochrome biogenesis protein CcmI [Paracoccaceae bacterium]